MDDLQAAPEDAGRWLAFLRHEEQLLSTSTAPLDAATTGGRYGVTLFHLYDWATKTIPRRGGGSGEAYLQIWLGYARHQGSDPPPLLLQSFSPALPCQVMSCLAPPSCSRGQASCLIPGAT